MHTVFGVILPDIEPENISKRSFLGIGFGKEGVPIDILPIFQLGKLMPDFSLLVVDEFLRLNCTDDDTVNYSLDRFLRTLERLEKVYGTGPSVILSSEFMRTEKYSERFSAMKARVTAGGLEDLALQTVPESKRHMRTALEYPLHEFACVEHMSDQGYGQKIGPGTERAYDAVMRLLGLPTEFAYILDSYAVGTSSTDKVVPYVPNSRGNKHGQRIYFSDTSDAVFSKVSGTDEAMRYMCILASVSGALLGLDSLSMPEIDALHGKRLRKTARRLVEQNIMRPYREVM